MGGRRGPCKSFAINVIQIITIICQVLTEEPRFAEPIPNVTVALGRDASLPCVVEHLGTYKEINTCGLMSPNDAPAYMTACSRIQRPSIGESLRSASALRMLLRLPRTHPSSEAQRLRMMAAKPSEA
ncbi:hypothetical protein evm_014271 [Chilo suppressalis]|nr:hypothetical protein evm_014271 [Chilo suppressalis]